MARLLDKMKEKEEITPEKKEGEIQRSMSSFVEAPKRVLRPKMKEKQISAKVIPETYALFTQINQSLGMSNNSVLNKLMSDYVRENKRLLEEY